MSEKTTNVDAALSAYDSFMKNRQEYPLTPDQCHKAPDVPEIAAQLYAVYGQATDFKNFQGNPMPAYSDLPPGVVKAWEAVASYVRNSNFEHGI